MSQGAEWIHPFAHELAHRRVLCVGLRQWKRVQVRPILRQVFAQVVCVPKFSSAQQVQRRYGVVAADWILLWGRASFAAVDELVRLTGARVVRMEDGFFRSVGLGSDLIAPLSVVLDTTGIYFDPTQSSDLERMLNQMTCSAQDLARAQAVRSWITEQQLTKYNVDELTPPSWSNQGAATQGTRRTVVLVPGQVEDDASVRFGCTSVRTNLALLRAARAAHPDAFLVYKPHPDVLAKNRVGQVAWADLAGWVDVVEQHSSVVACLQACDVVHTMTSQVGFEALLRGKQVVVYGRPFYAGWGLTVDRGEPFEAARRVRALSLDELVLGAVLRYPFYLDAATGALCSCEQVLTQLVAQREAQSRSAQGRIGWWRRQGRKVRVLLRALGSEMREFIQKDN